MYLKKSFFFSKRVFFSKNKLFPILFAALPSTAFRYFFFFNQRGIYNKQILFEKTFFNFLRIRGTKGKLKLVCLKPLSRTLRRIYRKALKIKGIKSRLHSRKHENSLFIRTIMFNLRHFNTRKYRITRHKRVLVLTNFSINFYSYFKFKLKKKRSNFLFLKNLVKNDKIHSFILRKNFVKFFKNRLLKKIFSRHIYIRKRRRFFFFYRIFFNISYLFKFRLINLTLPTFFFFKYRFFKILRRLRKKKFFYFLFFRFSKLSLILFQFFKKYKR
jgi:hypothetical protein